MGLQVCCVAIGYVRLLEFWCMIVVAFGLNCSFWLRISARLYIVVEMIGFRDCNTV